jgi:hypothetical protein
MKVLSTAVLALVAMTPLAFADSPGANKPSQQPVMLSDQQLDQVVGGHICALLFPTIFTGGGPTDQEFEGQPVFTVPEGDGSIHCALKPNGGIPIVIFTGHLGTGGVVIIGDTGEGAR